MRVANITIGNLFYSLLKQKTAQTRIHTEPGLPPGAYMLWLRHPDTGTQVRRRVTVRAGEAVTVEVDWVQETK